MSNIKKFDKLYIADTYARFDIAFVSGEGSKLYDEDGKEYIDLGSGIAVNSFGVADKDWEDAVTNQVKSLQHISNLYYTEPQVRLAEMLCKRSGMKKVFFGNSGAEANECAIKAARKYSCDKYGAEANRNVIITLKNSFHGRTLATLSATGQDVFHQHFFPFVEGFKFAKPNNAANLKNLIEENNVCAVMIELVQGEGGVITLDKDYVQEIAKTAAEKDILLIIDEIQTGNGRTGSLYCYEQYGIMPDIVTTAKGLAGGLPLGACLFSEKTKDVLDKSSHGSTFGGNPVSCAGAISILSRIDEALLEDVKKKGEYIKNELSSCKNVKSISGMGLMLGIECEKSSLEVVQKCLKKGVVVLTAKNKIRLLPALNIPMTDLEKAVGVIKEVIEE